MDFLILTGKLLDQFKATVDKNYSNIKKLGVEYPYLDYTKSLDFLMMTIKGFSEIEKE